jgi:hypothetical protein
MNVRPGHPALRQEVVSAALGVGHEPAAAESVVYEAVTARTQEEFDRSDRLDLGHLSLISDDEGEDGATA